MFHVYPYRLVTGTTRDASNIRSTAATYSECSHGQALRQSVQERLSGQPRINAISHTCRQLLCIE